MTVEDGAGGAPTNGGGPANDDGPKNGGGPANDDGPKNGGGPMNGGPKNGGEPANGGGPMNGGGPANDDGRTVGEGEDGSAATIDVLSLAAPPDPEHPRGRPAVKRLMVGDGANLIAFTFAPGQSFPDHSVAPPITVQCLSGELTFGCGDETIRLTPGAVVHCRERVLHRVDCPDDAPDTNVLLLTMLTGERH